MSEWTNQHVDDPNRQCIGKLKYPTKAKAKRFIARATIHNRDRLTVYRCPHCRFFHVGNRWRREHVADE